ncbi:hypothetical protein [Clavibacter michiganensis]|uniref:hypothetical protein n=1 Tax=Clavibacter michiganensis TaxID=28447 RepID=UPI00292F6F96|nr:hypothetical protein [Clavibacter michiganensis]
MSGVHCTLEAAAPSGAPAISVEELIRCVEEHTELDPLSLSPGRGSTRSGGSLVHVSADRKYTLDGLDAAAEALSRRLPAALVTCRQEWTLDELGGEATTYQAGKAIAHETLSWRPEPLPRA